MDNEFLFYFLYLKKCINNEIELKRMSGNQALIYVIKTPISSNK